MRVELYFMNYAFLSITLKIKSIHASPRLLPTNGRDDGSPNHSFYPRQRAQTSSRSSSTSSLSLHCYHCIRRFVVPLICLFSLANSPPPSAVHSIAFDCPLISLPHIYYSLKLGYVIFIRYLTHRLQYFNGLLKGQSNIIQDGRSD
jgi:hypothetical protein